MADALVSNLILPCDTSISRRELIRGVGVVVVGGALLAIGHDAWVTAPALPAPVAALWRSTFAGFLGDTFRVQLAPSGQLALRLAGIRDLLSAQTDRVSRGADREQNFLIQFRGPRGRPLGQQIYRVEHARIGAFALFIVPMAPDQDAQNYEAIFNRRQI